MGTPEAQRLAETRADWADDNTENFSNVPRIWQAVAGGRRAKRSQSGHLRILQQGKNPNRHPKMDDLSGTFQDKAYFRVEQRTVFFWARVKGRGSKGHNIDLNSIKTSNYSIAGGSCAGKKEGGDKQKIKRTRVTIHVQNTLNYLPRGDSGPIRRGGFSPSQQLIAFETDQDGAD